MTDMKIRDITKILQDEVHCLERRCNKKCNKCDLYRPESDRIDALLYAVKILAAQKEIKKEFFNSGIEYAKNEFVRLLETEKASVGNLHKSKAVDDLTYIQVLGLQKAIEITDSIHNK